MMGAGTITSLGMEGEEMQDIKDDAQGSGLGNKGNKVSIVWAREKREDERIDGRVGGAQWEENDLESPCKVV